MTADGLEEVLWASYVPLSAAARTGKVHLRAPGAPLTLCGRRVARPSKQFYPWPDDPRCQQCKRKGERMEDEQKKTACPDCGNTEDNFFAGEHGKAYGLCGKCGHRWNPEADEL